VVGRLRELLSDTRAYRARRDAYERNQSREMAARRIDLEAMIPRQDELMQRYRRLPPGYRGER
jgi:hypothetical protein